MVNPVVPTFNQVGTEVDVNQLSDYIIQFNIAFVNIQNIEDSVVKGISVDLMSEFFFPVALLIALLIPYLNFKNWIKYVIGILISSSFFFFKIIIMVYDNYSSPEYSLVDLSFPIHQIVYFVNSLVVEVGSSFNTESSIF